MPSIGASVTALLTEPAAPQRTPVIFALRSSNEMLNHFDISSVIGQGSFATIHKIQHIDTKQQLAAKAMKKSRVGENDIRQEQDIMTRMHHPNIVNLLMTFESPNRVIFVMDLCDGGSLLQRLERTGRESFPENVVRHIIRSTTEAIAYLHSLNIVHRDVKPENILFTKPHDESVIKLADFGLSTSCISSGERLTTVCGSHAYLSPEIVRCERGEIDDYDSSIDMWGVGLVGYMAYFGMNPFLREQRVETYSAILSAEPFIPKKGDASRDMLDLIAVLLSKTPSLRPSAKQVLCRVCFREMPPSPPSPRSILLDPEEEDNILLSSPYKTKGFNSSSFAEKFRRSLGIGSGRNSPKYRHSS